MLHLIYYYYFLNFVLYFLSIEHYENAVICITANVGATSKQLKRGSLYRPCTSGSTFLHWTTGSAVRYQASLVPTITSRLITLWPETYDQNQSSQKKN
jgi:hypothetical protein